MTDAEAVLSQNLEFYRAIGARDLAALERLWAQDAAVSCIHPGWPVIHGRVLVLQSWRAILTGPQAPRIRCSAEEAAMHGATALVTCEETLDGGSLAACNLFVLEHGVWRLAHHQATPIMARQQSGRSRPRSSIH
ncbi:hypothetical protein GCM10011611_13750 [Aliidongia dinghuensis]|uniref:SnoaL-like domain-containing protein n=1 Tax=Aliidongia dinghuensis TaxID=1867774 RepID=A0A8J2YR29_9PROT|nr:nuclear transport factor 2 family protein [Aliidongia dinghuensis]GGF09510.1 hypothetical protein GCM10011611_13750 [Aliidongia dinghuensis]